MREQKNVQLQQTTTTLTNDTLAKQKATEAVLTALNKAGIEGSTGNRRTGAGNA